jgi:hypothetical protein
MISKLEGWKMSNKNHKAYVKAFPGSTIEDMADCGILNHVYAKSLMK